MYIPIQLELKDSPIDGLGIFATIDIPAGTNLGKYEGKYMRHTEFKPIYGNDITYCYFKRRTWEYIVAKDERNWITYVNDGVHNQSIKKVNVCLKDWCCFTTQPIKAGEEILLDYGRYYKW